LDQPKILCKLNTSRVIAEGEVLHFQRLEGSEWVTEASYENPIQALGQFFQEALRASNCSREASYVKRISLTHSDEEIPDRKP